MKRRWSNNGGFQTLRMLEDSSVEVTSSSSLITPAMVMSPESLGSPEYGELELWEYEEALPLGYGGHGPVGAGLGGCAPPPLPLPLPLPPMALPHTPNTPKSENGSVSSGKFKKTSP